MSAPDILIKHGFQQVDHNIYKGHQFFSVLLGKHRIALSTQLKTISVAYEELEEYLKKNIKKR